MTRTEPKAINANQRSVLRVLAGLDSEAYMPFQPIAERTGLPRSEVRRACRALKRKGLAHFRNGLWTEDGDMAGAGYGATEEGRELIGDDAIVEYVD